ncbi:MAG: hydroxypyruvate isomerase family protein [Planctomycetota bacterium]
MQPLERINRRDALLRVAGGVAILTGAPLALPAVALTPQQATPAGAAPLSGRRFQQSICRWCYGNIPLDELCRQALRLGYASVELLDEREWHLPAQHGLTCAVANGPTSIRDGLNRPDLHERFSKDAARLLPLIRAQNIPNMIVFAGNRAGLSDAEGLKNCATGLKSIVSIAEAVGVTVVMELLNSKIDHKDYQCDRTAWGVELVNRVASPRFKLLYDIYHMQIMEGDVIRTITDNHEHIAHYHTGGVPGRAEIDDSQELNYAAICRALVATNFTGFLGQEFIPRRDPLTSLAEAYRICAV